MADFTQHASLDVLLTQMGLAGARVCAIDASEASAGNISVCASWPIDVASRFPITEDIQLPSPAPALAGHTILASGSGQRLRQIGDDPAAAIGAVIVDDGGLTARLFTSPRRQFKNLTSEFNSHLAVHQDQFERRGIDFQAVVHAQPMHLTYLSHMTAYRSTEVMNRRILRWEPETIVSLSAGIGVLPFAVPGSPELMAANIAGLRDFQIVLWSKHGVMARSSESVQKAVDLIEYAETGARYEYMDILAGGLAEGLTAAEKKAVATAFGVDSPWVEQQMG